MVPSLSADFTNSNKPFVGRPFSLRPVRHLLTEAIAPISADLQKTARPKIAVQIKIISYGLPPIMLMITSCCCPPLLLFLLMSSAPSAVVSAAAVSSAGATEALAYAPLLQLSKPAIASVV